MATGLPLPTCSGGRRSTTIKSVGVLRNPMVNREPRRKESAFTSIAASISTICPSIIVQEKSSRAIVGGITMGRGFLGTSLLLTFGLLGSTQFGLRRQCLGAISAWVL